uniref:AB hydrolase-1 domain-containing protein n=1 Tax=Rhabditophanes sp. KR3021 TaxID=114890 RepID=A0AC35TW66_9BILA
MVSAGTPTVIEATPAVAKSCAFKFVSVCLENIKDAERRLLGAIYPNIVETEVPVSMAKGIIHTISVNNESAEYGTDIPFVLVHGFASGVGLWTKNLAALASKRQVYAIDLLGFARSSRPQFDSDPALSELQYVQSIEDWRKEMKIEKMVLCGHSFGAFISSSYALEHPSRVRHLVLADPWGFAAEPAEADKKFNIPPWLKAVGSVVTMFNPLATLRLARSFAPYLVKKLRPDLGSRYGAEDPDAIYDYVYQCNAQAPSGEIAFRGMMSNFAWAKRPMCHRFGNLDSKVPVTFICGSKSWIDPTPLYELQAKNTNINIEVQVVEDAGHHVYADQPEDFNQAMCELSDLIERNADLVRDVE